MRLLKISTNSGYLILRVYCSTCIEPVEGVLILLSVGVAWLLHLLETSLDDTERSKSTISSLMSAYATSFVPKSFFIFFKNSDLDSG